jgi:hypothetical protein
VVYLWVLVVGFIEAVEQLEEAIKQLMLAYAPPAIAAAAAAAAASGPQQKDEQQQQLEAVVSVEDSTSATADGARDDSRGSDKGLWMSLGCNPWCHRVTGVFARGRSVAAGRTRGAVGSTARDRVKGFKQLWQRLGFMGPLVELLLWLPGWRVMGEIIMSTPGYLKTRQGEGGG